MLKVGVGYTRRAKIRSTVCGDLHFITPVRQRLQFRLYLRRHADKKANSTREIFGPKCMECTLGYGGAGRQRMQVAVAKFI